MAAQLAHHAALFAVVALPATLRAQGRVSVTEGHRVPKALDRVEVVFRRIVNSACEEKKANVK